MHFVFCGIFVWTSGGKGRRGGLEEAVYAVHLLLGKGKGKGKGKGRRRRRRRRMKKTEEQNSRSPP